MKYAPIKAILARNFRNLEEVIVDFTESPIVSLVGENEAGKSSVIKAIQTIGANLDPNRQREYIRTGANGFLLAIKFADEEQTMVVRQKGPSINSYWVQKDANVVWSVQKMDDSSVPQEVQKYMGFVLEPETKELLNVRTYEDLMIFIHTSNSTNYKIMYNALKVESLMRAKKIGQQEANACKRIINDAEASIETLTEQLRKIKLVDLEPVLVIKQRLQSEQDIIRKTEEAASCYVKLQELDKQSEILRQVSSLETIDIMEAYLLNSVRGNLRKVSDLNKKLKLFDGIDSLEVIDENQIKMMKSILDMKRRLSDSKAEEFAEIEKAELIDVNTLVNIRTALENKDKLGNLDSKIQLYSESLPVIDTSSLDMLTELEKEKEQLSSYDNQIRQIQLKIKEFEQLMKESGVLVTTCSNCGKTVIFSEVYDG